MKQERILNPSLIDRAAIEAKIAAGYDVILQFDAPRYTPELLKNINNLCGEFGSGLAVRFYGHYGDKFDCANLHFLPDVAALWLDCLQEVTNLSVLSDLANLRRLSLGIFRLNDPQILKSLQLQNLEVLVIGETAKPDIDLAPLGTCDNLTEIHLVRQTKNIDHLARLSSLRTLSLAGFPKGQPLNFVSAIKSLRRLVLILGGRANISEIQHSSLEELEILRVLGFNNVDSIEAFPSLRSLVIEDQIRLENIQFTESSKKVRSLRIYNCKNLRSLTGLGHLTELHSARIGMTSLSINSILDQNLAPSLQVFGFYTGKEKENAVIRTKLDSLGYREYEDRNR